MATASSLISKVHSIFHNPIYRSALVLELRICLRNLNVHLVCLRNVGEVMKSLVSRIDVAIGRVPIHNAASFTAEVNFENAFVRALVDSLREVDCHPEEVNEEIFFVRALIDSLREVNGLVKEVNDEWLTNAVPNCLALDDVVEVADSILQSAADFWIVVEVCSDKILNPANLRYVMEEFEVQTRFLRDFLLFAKWSGIENQQVHNLLIHIRPFVLDATCSFMVDGLLSIHDVNWVQELQSKCPRVNPEVFQACTQTLLCTSTLDHQTDDVVLKDFLGSLISLLWHVLRYHRHQPCHSDSLKALYECLRLSRSILKQQRKNNGSFEGQMGVLIRDAGIVICSLYLTGVDSPYLLDLLQRFDVLRAHVPPESNSLKEIALDVGDSTTTEEISDGKVRIATATASHHSSSTPQVVGFQDDELALVLDRLTRGSKQLRLVPISGMAGLGKTTFALRVYNHRSIIYGFQAHAWCTVSQVFHKKRVLLQLLNQIQPGDYSNMSEDDLANKLRQSLKQKRYLILLDDVWTPQVWESLRPSFPDDGTQSRILLTSQLHVIVPHALPDEQPHFLRLRKENECLEIIEMKLLHNVGYSVELGKFAKLCKGLPLTAILVAGLLSTTVQEGWEGVLDQSSSGGISQMEQCKIALEFSYKNLPEYLKLCFLYIGAFPEDEEIDTKKLIRLWMAEGFVAKINDLLKERTEDVAREYLDSLIQRNLVMVDKKRSTGGVKTCRIHDLLHEFCLMKGK